jgi:hypothetical protein
MNKHLQPVFDDLLPVLEGAGIEYWVYGGVGRAGVVGRFIRPNGDVDIFVKEIDFRPATSLLEDKCNEMCFASRLVEAWRPKITRARNQKRPGTSGRGRNQEGEALNQTGSVGIRPWAVLKRGSAHEPPPENVGREGDVVGMLDRRRARAWRLRP